MGRFNSGIHLAAQEEFRNKFGNAFIHSGQARILQSVRAPFSGAWLTPAPRPVERQDAGDAQVHLRCGDGREAGI